MRRECQNNAFFPAENRSVFMLEMYHAEVEE